MKVEFETPGDFRCLSFLRRLFYHLAHVKELALSSRDSFRLTHILIEAYNNAVVHPHGKKRDRRIQIVIEIFPKRVVLKVGDEGKGWNGKKVRMPKLAATGGRGLALIKAFGGKIRRQQQKGRHWVHIDYKKTL